MCITPRVWDIDGLKVEVGCSKCWQCRSNRMWDWVGRCIAEAETSAHVRVVTLTYGDSDRIGTVPNVFAASSIVKRHARLWVKRMRKGHVAKDKDGKPVLDSNGKPVYRRYPVRYLIAAEYGSEKGRAHWHAVLFFSENVPDIPLDVRHHGGDEFWPHGITYWQAFTPAAAVYVCKYILKSQGIDNRLLRSERLKQREGVTSSWATLSRKPPLGAEYFRSRAEEYVRVGLAPQDLIYTFPEVREYASKRIRKFHLKRGSASADLFLRHYVETWAKVYGTHPPQSEVVEEYLDRLARPEGVTVLRQVRMKARPRDLPEGGRELVFVEALNSYACDVERNGAVKRLFWSYDDNGFPAWNAYVVSETEAGQRRERARLARDPAAYRAASQSSLKRPPLLRG